MGLTVNGALRDLVVSRGPAARMVPSDRKVPVVPVVCRDPVVNRGPAALRAFRGRPDKMARMVPMVPRGLKALKVLGVFKGRKARPENRVFRG